MKIVKLINFLFGFNASIRYMLWLDDRQMRKFNPNYDAIMRKIKEQSDG